MSWSAPGAALNTAGAKGKKVAYIPIIVNIPYTQEVSGAFKEAMGALGVNVVFFGGTQGTPTRGRRLSRKPWRRKWTRSCSRA